MSTINNIPLLFFGGAKVVNNQLPNTYKAFFFNRLLGEVESGELKVENEGYFGGGKREEFITKKYEIKGGFISEWYKLKGEGRVDSGELEEPVISQLLFFLGLWPLWLPERGMIGSSKRYKRACKKQAGIKCRLIKRKCSI